jgi:hypothetical protein
LPSPPKPTVRESVEDYSFVFTLKKCDESERDFAAPLTTFVLEGDEAVKFLKTGKSGWLKLDSPVLLGHFERDGFFRLFYWQDIVANHSDLMTSMHALRKSDGKSCELNYQTGLDYIDEEEEEDRSKFQFNSGSVIGASDLEAIIMSPKMVDERGLSIARDLRVTASKECAGSTEYMHKITHIRFIAMLYDADGVGYQFNDPSNELATGVTVADIFSRLDVKWK